MQSISQFFGAVLAAISLSTAADSVCLRATDSFDKATKIYVKQGSAAFMQQLLKDGPLAEDKRALGQAQTLQQIEQFFGPMQGSSVISTKEIGSRVCYLVGVVEYANGPAFAVATYYQGAKGVAPTSMIFKTEPETIFSNSLLVK